jgi:hypothetical protein
MPVSDALAMAYKSRLAFFQSIGVIAMCNMAYERNCKFAKWTLQMGNCWCLQSLQPHNRNTLQFAFVNLHFAMVFNVGQVPPGNGRMPVSDPLAMASKSRLALFQSIVAIAMCNMAYGGNCKFAKWTLQMGNCWCLQSLQPRSRNTLQFAFVNLHFAMVFNVGQVPPGNGCTPMSDVIAVAYKSRLALFQCIGVIAMYNMAYERNCKLAIHTW